MKINVFLRTFGHGTISLFNLMKDSISWSQISCTRNHATRSRHSKRTSITYAVIIFLYQGMFSADAAAGIDKISSCPSQDPRLFLKKYSAHVELQKKYTFYPLKYTYVVNDPSSDNFLNEETMLIKDISSLPYVKNNNSIFPSKMTRDREGILIKIKKNNDTFVANLYKPDTDYINVFTFAWKENCWALISINSKSI